MKNPNTKKKLRVVLIAAIVGAILFAVTTPILNLEYNMWKHGHINDTLDGICEMFSYVFILITEIGMRVLGFERFTDLSNPKPGLIYIGDGVVGAFLFAFLTAFWQFLVKGSQENKNQNTKT